MELEINDADNGVNDPICSRQVGSRSAGNGVRHFRSSASENLTTLQIGRKNKALKVACWNVRTMFEAGKLENVKSEMSRLDINPSIPKLFRQPRQPKRRSNRPPPPVATFLLDTLWHFVYYLKGF